MAPHAVVAPLRLPDGDATLVDAMEDGPSARALLAAVVARARAPGVGGTDRREPFTELEVARRRARATSAPSTPRPRSATAIATC